MAFSVIIIIILLITVLYCTVLYCTVLYCTVLYCTVLYCTVLYYFPSCPNTHVTITHVPLTPLHIPSLLHPPPTPADDAAKLSWLRDRLPGFIDDGHPHVSLTALQARY
jgi:hypothetical protein